MQIFIDANDRTGILLNLAAFLMLAQRRGQKVRELRLAGATHKLRKITGPRLLDVPMDLIQFTMPIEPSDSRGRTRVGRGRPRCRPKKLPTTR